MEEKRLLNELVTKVQVLFHTKYRSYYNSYYITENISSRRSDVIECLFNICQYHHRNLEYIGCSYYKTWYYCSFCNDCIFTDFTEGNLIICVEKCQVDIDSTWNYLCETTKTGLRLKYMFIKCILGRDLAIVIMRPISFMPAMVCIE